MQPARHAWNPRQGGHGDQEGPDHGPKGLGPKASGSGVCDVQKRPCFHAPNDIARYTIEELLDITAHYATDEEATGPLPVLGDR
jgi:hypothetical protein